MCTEPIHTWLPRRARLPWRADGMGGHVQDDGRGFTHLSYSIAGMPWGSVEMEPEIRDWLEALPTASFATAAFYVDLLAEQGPAAG